MNKNEWCGQKDRQIDRQTNRQIDRKTNRQTDRQTDRQTALLYVSGQAQQAAL